MTAFTVHHVTRYRYEQPATLCHNEAHLCMRSTPDQTVDESWVIIDPAPDDRSERIDLYGNWVTYFSLQSPHDQLEVAATSRVRRSPTTRHESEWLPWEAARDAPRGVNEWDLTIESPHVPLLSELHRLTDGIFTPGRPLAEAVAELCRRIYDEFAYDPTATSVSTPLSDVLAGRHGVCQDFAHLAIAALRHLGLSARYVSGYLETLPPPGQPKLKGADASHAWASVRTPTGTWLDFDPTNALVAPDTHLTVAWGRDYSDVMPLRGVVMSSGATTQLDVEVDVERVDPSA